MSKDLDNLSVAAMLLTEAAKGNEVDWDSRKVMLESTSEFEVGSGDMRRWEAALRAEMKEREVAAEDYDGIMDIVVDIFENDPKIDALEADDKEDLLDRLADKLLRKVHTKLVKEQHEELSDGAIGDADFAKWVEVVQAEADELGININNERNFNALAMDILDNDPKLDTFEDVEAVKAEVLKSLWHEHNSSKARSRVGKFKPSATSRSDNFGTEEEEVRTNGLSHAKNVLGASELRKLMTTAFKAGQTGCEEPCPYPAKSTERQLWQKAFKSGADAKRYGGLHKEDEEYTDIEGQEGTGGDLGDGGQEPEPESPTVTAHKEGFASCAQAYAESAGEYTCDAEINPYEEGSEEFQAFQDGWDHCKEVLDGISAGDGIGGGGSATPSDPAAADGNTYDQM